MVLGTSCLPKPYIAVCTYCCGSEGRRWDLGKDYAPHWAITSPCPSKALQYDTRSDVLTFPVDFCSKQLPHHTRIPAQNATVLLFSHFVTRRTTEMSDVRSESHCIQD